MSSEKDLQVLKVKPHKKKEHPLDKQLHPELCRHPYCQLIIAPPKQGKSNLLINLLMNPQFYNAEEYYDEVIYCSPSQMHDETVKHCLPKLPNIVQIYDTDELMHLDVILKEIITSQKKLVKEDKEMKRIWIILDDCIGFFCKELSILSSKYRHNGLSITVVSQGFRQIPLLVRNCAQSIIFFHLNNEKELIKIDEEYGSNYCSDFIEKAKHHTSEKYSFVHLNNETLRMTKNFTELIVDGAAHEIR
jgi:hypothetical protein